MPKDILAIDPGNHCGMAWRMSDDKVDDQGFNIPDTNVSYDAAVYYEEEEMVFGQIVRAPRPKLVVIETFHTAGNISKYGLYTVDLIGGIRAICWYLDIPLIEHEPYVRRAFMARAIDTLKLQRKSGRFTTHERDALAHLYAYEHRANLHMERISGTPGRTNYGKDVSGGSLPAHAKPTTPQTLRAKLRDDHDLH